MSDLYNQRGVSAQKEDVLAAIKGMDKGLYENTFCKILPDTLTKDDDYCCIMHADTAGTKSILAYLYWKETGDLSVWKYIAQDAMVMNLDDMACSGAVDHFVLSSTIARNKNRIPKEVLSAIIQGCNELIASWKVYGIAIHHAGGETADVGDLVQTVDVGYTAFARLERKNVIRVCPKPGDVIVGLASYGKAVYETEYNSGIGCNGLTSARHDLLSKWYKINHPESYDTTLPDDVVYIGPYRLTDTTPQGTLISQLLLSPTRTFTPLLSLVLNNFRSDIRGIIHNTGGGQTKCMKYIPDTLHVIKDNLLPFPEVFTLIQEHSKVSDREMLQVFNLGTRMEMYTDENTAKNVITLASEFGIEAAVVGRFEASNTKKLSVHINNNTEVFQY